MKKLFRFLMVALTGVAMTALFSCEKEVTAPGGGGDNGGGDNGGGGGNNNPYGALVYGSWQVDLLSVDGQNMTPENMLIVLNPDGSGVMNDNGETENNGFTWTINGSTLTIAPRGHQFTFTIDSVTATECAFHGDYIEFGGQDIRGDIRFHMVKSGNNGGNNGGDNGGGNGGGDTTIVNDVWVDLGLPSGTKWKNANEVNAADTVYNFYTYDEAVAAFGDALPTKEQLEELKDNCQWTWSDSGYATVTGRNGHSIVLPAAGYRNCDGNVYGVGSYGYYWSSTPHGSDYAWDLYFYSGGVDMNRSRRCRGYSVRLVQD